MEDKLHAISNGEILLWTEGKGSLMIKAGARSGDPVELNSEEAKELAHLLLRLAEDIK